MTTDQMKRAKVVVYPVLIIIMGYVFLLLLAFPILFTAMAYMNMKIMVIGNCVVLGANILRLITNMDKLYESGGSTMVVSVLVCGLVAYGSIRITRLLVKFNAENMSTILEVSASSSEGLENSNITVSEVEKCKKIFESVYELAQDLQKY